MLAALIALAIQPAQADSRFTSLTWASLGVNTVSASIGADAAVGIRGYTARKNALEASANLFSTEEGIGGHLIRLSGYRYSKGGTKAAWYGGGGLGLGGYTGMGFGVQAHGALGYEFQRRKSVGSFVQADLTVPLVSIEGGGFENWSPVLGVRFGIGLGGNLL